MNRILSIDPSGTGTTGVYFKDGDREIFISHQDQDWKKHWQFIHGLVKQWHPQFLLFETTNFIHLRGKDMTSLFKLLGAMEVLPVERVKSVPVNQVKALKDQLFKGTKQIPNLTYQKGRGKGWTFNHYKLNLHELDAYLVHYLGDKHD